MYVSDTKYILLLFSLFNFGSKLSTIKFVYFAFIVIQCKVWFIKQKLSIC